MISPAAAADLDLSLSLFLSLPIAGPFNADFQAEDFNQRVES
jgi:hypothetical protein